MKKLKQIFSQVKHAEESSPEEYLDLIWQLICYPPKMPVRYQQQLLLDEAEKFQLNVTDPHFAKKELLFSCFKWGSGTKKVLITHGWGSKAADFFEMITALCNSFDLEIIAFDAPGNGSSEGELSNLLLFAGAVKEIIMQHGAPDIIIGHSLGAMANILALTQLNISTSLIISLTPLIRLKENFEASMNLAGVSQAYQQQFLKSFEGTFSAQASDYNLNHLYRFEKHPRHWMAYDEDDQISNYLFIKEFLKTQPSVQSHNYPGTGHERIIKSPDVINDVIALISSHITVSQ